ncbi:MAG: hypothetical protein ACJ8C4_14425 [Gemmataceae bacterium]
MKDHDPVGWIGFVASFAALLVAIALNVIPIGDWAKFNGELYRLWSDLNRDVVIEELKAAERNEGKNVKEGHVARLGELLSKVEARTPWIIQAIASF